ncbi:hypothetical protein M3B20_01425 [Corynebacterium sanguinis]|uniref:hypothetical protein n=1 Tax=Corynebacterium sanguinis TaxID=2594913 RepID=UPI0021A578EB|nr:hypothetical protein [Corynebacterium sanguinis]MCT1804396.1 hypothetical protein [Corynebacterium sanguinis]
MSKRKRKEQELRKRVQQAPLPPENLRKPRSWARMESQARRELAAATRSAGLA